MRVLLIIPAYNEADNILNTITGIKKTNIKNVTLDYIIINDGSKDNTLEILIKNNLNYINLPYNLGIGGAVQTGYKYAYYNDYDIAIQFDGDGQHNPNYVEKLINKINSGNDLVVGSRFVEDIDTFKSTKIRKIGINFLSTLITILTGQKITDPTSGFRACNKKIIKLFAFNYPSDYPEPDTLVTLLKNNYKVTEVSTQMNERIGGKSSITLFKSVYYMIKVSFSMIITGLSRKGF